MRAFTIGSIVLAAAFTAPAFAAEATGVNRVDYGPGPQSETQKSTDYTEFARATAPDGSPGQRADTHRDSQHANNSATGQSTR